MRNINHKKEVEYKEKRKANLMGRVNRGSFVQLLRVESNTERSLDARTEGLRVTYSNAYKYSSATQEEETHTQSNDTRVVDLGFHKGRRVKLTNEQNFSSTLM